MDTGNTSQHASLVADAARATERATHDKASQSDAPAAGADSQPRITPEQIEWHVRRAHQLHSEAIAQYAVRLFTVGYEYARRLSALLRYMTRGRGSVRAVQPGTGPIERDRGSCRATNHRRRSP